MNKAASILLAATITLALSASSALAQAYTTGSPGQNCVGSSATNRDRITYYSGGAQNTSTSTVTVYCPVNGIEEQNIDFGGIWVAVTDNSTTGAVDCRLYVRTNIGTVFTSSSTALETNGPFTGDSLLYLADPVNSGSPINNQNGFAGVSVLCTLPGNSSGSSRVSSVRADME